MVHVKPLFIFRSAKLVLGLDCEDLLRGNPNAKRKTRFCEEDRRNGLRNSFPNCQHVISTTPVAEQYEVCDLPTRTLESDWTAGTES